MGIKKKKKGGGRKGKGKIPSLKQGKGEILAYIMGGERKGKEKKRHRSRHCKYYKKTKLQGGPYVSLFCLGKGRKGREMGCCALCGIAYNPGGRQANPSSIIYLRGRIGKKEERREGKKTKDQFSVDGEREKNRFCLVFSPVIV